MDKNFGLTILFSSIVVVSPDSPIRHHVELNNSLLTNIKEILNKDIQL